MAGRVPTRIYPEVRIQERGILPRIMGVIFALIGLGVTVGVGVPSLVQEPSLEPLVFVFVGLLFIYAGLYVAGLDLREWVLALSHRRTWEGLQVTADGKILERSIKEQKDSYGHVTYTYWLTSRFDSTEGPVTLRPRVEKRYYERFKEGDPVAVRYALDSPRLALLEGEWVD